MLSLSVCYCFFSILSVVPVTWKQRDFWESGERDRFWISEGKSAVVKFALSCFHPSRERERVCETKRRRVASEIATFASSQHSSAGSILIRNNGAMLAEPPTRLFSLIIEKELRQRKCGVSWFFFCYILVIRNEFCFLISSFYHLVPLRNVAFFPTSVERDCKKCDTVLAFKKHKQFLRFSRASTVAKTVSPSEVDSTIPTPTAPTDSVWRRLLNPRHRQSSHFWSRSACKAARLTLLPHWHSWPDKRYNRWIGEWEMNFHTEEYSFLAQKPKYLHVFF